MKPVKTLAIIWNISPGCFKYPVNVRIIIHLLKKLFLLKIIIKYEPKN